MRRKIELNSGKHADLGMSETMRNGHVGKQVRIKEFHGSRNARVKGRVLRGSDITMLAFRAFWCKVQGRLWVVA